MKQRTFVQENFQSPCPALVRSISNSEHIHRSYHASSSTWVIVEDDDDNNDNDIENENQIINDQREEILINPVSAIENDRVSGQFTSASPRTVLLLPSSQQPPLQQSSSSQKNQQGDDFQISTNDKKRPRSVISSVDSSPSTTPRHGSVRRTQQPRIEVTGESFGDSSNLTKKEKNLVFFKNNNNTKREDDCDNTIIPSFKVSQHIKNASSPSPTVSVNNNNFSTVSSIPVLSLPSPFTFETPSPCSSSSPAHKLGELVCVAATPSTTTSKTIGNTFDIFITEFNSHAAHHIPHEWIIKQGDRSHTPLTHQLRTLCSIREIFSQESYEFLMNCITFFELQERLYQGKKVTIRQNLVFSDNKKKNNNICNQAREFFEENKKACLISSLFCGSKNVTKIAGFVIHFFVDSN